MISWLVIGAYIFFLTFVLVYSFVQLNLTSVYLRSKRANWPGPAPILPSKLPVVTVQLPIYNEKYVVERLIDAVACLDYPKERLEIQLLDDSDDETEALIANKVRHYQVQGFDMVHIRRPERKDFKAGALQYGTNCAKGEHIAIFDADFVPDPAFLQKTVPYFQNETVGVVQSRWGHLNQDYSILTKLQSYVLNAHFTVDQGGRNFGEHFINFNGTAGIWRKKTIEQSGGWQGDTLTEDLDLSYRAQLNDWRFIYLEDLESPAELPAEMNALKTQQFRWAKGAAECSRKNLGRVLSAPKVKLSTKFNAIFHLLNSFNWVCLMASGVLLFPFLKIVHDEPEFNNSLGFMGIYYVSFVVLFVYYFIANRQLKMHEMKDYLYFFFSYPIFLSLMMGLSIYNAVGVIEGYLGIKSSFVRTPKFNITAESKSITNNSYVKLKFNFVTLLELVGVGYFLFTGYYAFSIQNYAAVPFTILMALGLAVVLLFSGLHYARARS